MGYNRESDKVHKEETGVRIAVVNEVSAKDKNKAICEALEVADAEVYNIGMSGCDGESELTYIHTGLMAALALESGAADFVVGGCGTGQGFMLSAMQYPSVYCGLITNPLDAWLFSQINAGNCVSLALNKGFGWAGDLNLRYIFEKLFCDESGRGYPLHRSESQRDSRHILSNINAVSHKDSETIIKSLDKRITDTVLGFKAFSDFISISAKESRLKELILNY